MAFLKSAPKWPVWGQIEERVSGYCATCAGSVSLGSPLKVALEYARSFTSPERAAMAVGHIKRAVQTGAELPLEAGLALERELQAKLFASDDAREGIRAFVEKRKPEFEGR